MDRKTIKTALSKLDRLSRAEYDVGLEELLLSTSPEAALRLQRIVGIVLKRPFAEKAPPNPQGITGARRSWPWLEKSPKELAAEGPRELAILNKLRMPGPWNERRKVGKNGDVIAAKSNWDEFKDDADNERGLFKILVLYVDDKLKKRKGKSLQEYVEAKESRRFEAGLNLTTLLFDAAVIGPLVSLLGIPAVAVGLALVVTQYGYRVATDPNVDRVGDRWS